MIYRLLKKEGSVRSPPLISKSELSESLFIEQFSRIIKLVKKKEDLYLRILQASQRNEIANGEEPFNFMKEYEALNEEGRTIETILANFKNENYFSSKTYLYSFFMRVREMFDANRQRYRADDKKAIETAYETAKNGLIEIYNNQSYLEQFNLSQIILYVHKNQNGRITQFFPKKRLTLLSPINRPVGILEKLRQEPKTDKSSNLRKTISVELGKEKESKIDKIISKKLIVKELATEKRIEQRKKPKPKVISLFKLYDILDIKAFPADRSGTYRDELESGMNERNQRIKDEMKLYQKKFLIFNKKQKK